MRSPQLVITAALALLACGLTGRACLAAGGCTHLPAPAGVAVIIGNGAYADGIPVLSNPVHDAEAAAKAVAALGFAVFLAEDADGAAMQGCLDEAYAGSAGADIAMLHYSGHEIQIRDDNYLVATGDAVSVLACDPTGRYMVRSFAVGAGREGMEIWDLADEKVTTVAAPIVNILGIDPRGRYVSALAFSDEANGLYDLAAAAKGHPPTIPDGFSVEGSRVYEATGALINQDLNPDPWRDWPDETLFGPALVEKATAGLTAAERDEVARERITYSVARNP